jgi:uncharacterized protein
MHTYIKRSLEEKLKTQLEYFPAVAILGPRQCGKSTLAKHIRSHFPDLVYIDLERPSDKRKLDDPEIFFEHNKGKLVCLDEVQRLPNLFPVLRSILDDNNSNGQVIILGSASPELIKQSSETLAGRIAYLNLTPFLLTELHSLQEFSLNAFWSRGGFAKSFLAPNDQLSMEWRLSFIQTFLERDIPNLGFAIPAEKLRRLWSMLAHYHGGLLNRAKIGEGLGISGNTVQSYIDLLEQTFMIRVLRPYESNLKKRLVKSPKVYIRDSGILHSLLEIESFDSLLGHSQFGASWEGMCLENILSTATRWKPYFYRTAGGAEIDLILEKGERKIAIEFKASKSPEVSKGFWQAKKELGIEEALVVAPIDKSYFAKEGIEITTLNSVIEALETSS